MHVKHTMFALRAVTGLIAEVKKMSRKNKEKMKEAGGILLFAVGVNAPFFAHVWGLI